MPRARRLQPPRRAAGASVARALLEAFDRADERAFDALAGECFALDEDGGVVDREALLAQLRARRAKGSPPVGREWKVEQVRVAPDVAVFTVDAVEHFPASGTRPAKTVTGHNTIVFAHSGGTLRPVYWKWQLSGPEVARQEWNTVFRGRASTAISPTSCWWTACADARRGPRSTWPARGHRDLGFRARALGSRHAGVRRARDEPRDPAEGSTQPA